MTDLVGFTINVFLFVILMVAIIGPVKSAFKLDEVPSYVLAACVSGLGVIGMNHFLRGSMRIVLLPYAALGISILLVLLISFIGTKGHLSDYITGQKGHVKRKRKRLKR